MVHQEIQKMVLQDNQDELVNQVVQVSKVDLGNQEQKEIAEIKVIVEDSVQIADPVHKD